MESPPNEVLKAVVQRYARLVGALGDEIGRRPMVLPTNEFFPDTFEADEPSAARLAARMQGHAGLEDIPIRTRVVSLEGVAPERSNCSSGACAVPGTGDGGVPRLHEEGDGWVLQIPAAELSHPVVLTCNVARALGHVFMLETTEDDELLKALPVEAELSSVALGLGSLLLAGSYIYSKSCGGPSIAKVTTLSTPELAMAFALFARQSGHPVRQALKELGATQSDLVREAESVLASNPAVVEALRDDPAQLVAGDFELGESKPWLLRVLGGKKKARPRSIDAVLADTTADLEDIEAVVAAMPARKNRADKPDPQKDELRSLVEEALEESRAEA